MMDRVVLPASRLLMIISVSTLLACCKAEGPAQYAGYVEGEYLYLAAPEGGYLAALDAPRGTRVAQGAVVFSVAADPEQQGLDEAHARERAAREQVRNLGTPRRPSEVAAIEAQMRAAQAAERLSGSQLQQQAALAAQGFVSAARLDEARATHARDIAQLDAARQQLMSSRSTLGRQPEVRAAEAEMAAAQAQVAQKRWQVEKKVVSAPAPGQIAETYYRPGEWVAAGQPVVSLLPDDRRRIRFFVPEAMVARVHTGDVVEATCDGCPAVIRATIDFVAPEAEYTPPVIYSRGSREKLVFRVEAVPSPQQGPMLRPGLPVDVRLTAR